jgi:VCBS repeat-containing protein
MRSKAALVLEPRILFDGALVITAIEADSAEDSAAEVVQVAEPAETQPQAQPAATETVDAAGDETVEPAADADEPAAETATVNTAAEDGAAVSDDSTAPETVAAAQTEDDTDVATAPEAPSRTEVVFVDSRVNDPAAFGTDGREVVVIAADQDGLSQIASALDGRTGIGAIHIVSHGGDGYLSLGSGSITADSLRAADPATLQLIGQALSEDGDILIYACDYAAGESGLEAMQLIADLTGADVAASSDATGHESLGGDWTLEQSTGAIETAELAPLAWMNALDFTFTGVGTVGALGLANNIMGAGVTVVSATYQGGATQSGTFTAGSGVTFGSDVLGFTSGVILSTSEDAAGVAGPNNNGAYGTDALSGVDGDAALNAMAGFPTFDAAILNISFIPDLPPGAAEGDLGRMTLEIVFGSDEYLEYIGQINDVMEVTVNGQVVSLVPNASGGESTIGINSVNNTSNPALFIDNTAGTYNTQMDAFTITIPMVFDVFLGQTNTIRLAVADASDSSWDSWMFIRADSGQTVVVAEDDQVSTAANLPITVDLTANDYSLAGGNLTLTHIQGDPVTQGQVITLGSGIQLTVGAGGQVTVTGNGSSAANDTFTYQVSNGMGGIASATVNVDVTAPNLNPPVAQDDVESVLANATLSDSVLGNNGNGIDSDPNGDPLSVVQVNLTGFTPGDPITLPSGALLTMNANGSYVYDPNGAFVGLADGATTTDSFSYTITDGQGGNATATVAITVTGVASNHAPVAVDDSHTVSEEGAAFLGNPLDNDSDADGDPLSFVLGSLTGSNGGSISTDDSGNLIFTAGAAFDDLAVGQTRDTSFTYTVSDGQGASDTGTITVTVQGANDAPVAQNDQFDVSEDGAHFLGGVLDNDSDVDSSGLWISLNGVTGSNGGTFTLDDSGNLIFIPGASFNSLAAGQTRETSITYVVNDNHGGQSAATVTVTVHGANDAPVGEADHFLASEDAAIWLGDLTQNDWDVEGDPLVADTSVFGSGAQGGFFVFDDGGNLIFNPGSDFQDLGEGETRDTWFDYTLYDDQGATAVANVTVTVLGANDVPVAEDDSFVAFEDIPVTLGSVTGNDSDVDGDDLYLQLVGSAPGSTGGRFTVDGDGHLVFDPEGDFESLGAGDTLDTSFVYQVNDGHGGVGEATVTVTVTGANDAPVAGADHYEAVADVVTPLGNPLDNDTDAEGHALTLQPTQATAGSQGGLFSVDENGQLWFDPAGEFNDLLDGETRDTHFNYTVTDSQGGVGSGTVTVTVYGGVTTPVVAMAADDAMGEPAMGMPIGFPNQIVFVDARVSDPAAFATGGRELVIIDTATDGIVQMANALAGRSGIEAIHIVSHGSEGVMTLGLGDIQTASLDPAQIQALQTLATALTENADILVYACEFAGGQNGIDGMLALAQFTQADVAASLFVTGDPALGGNWSLEATVGAIETSSIAPQDWGYLLDDPQDSAAAQPVRVMGTPVAKPTPVISHFTEPETRSAQSADNRLALTVVSEPVPQTPPTVRVQALETALRDGIAGSSAWKVGRTEAWTASPLWLEDLVLDGTVDGNDADEPLTASVGFQAQLQRFAQWGVGRPLVRAAVRG